MNDEKLHSVLRRQLRRVDLEDVGEPPDAQAWQEFLERVDRAYRDADQSRYILERSLEISSQEMRELYDQIAESEQRFRELVEQSPDAIGLVRDERISFLNSTAIEMLADDPSEPQLVGEPVSRIAVGRLSDFFDAEEGIENARLFEGQLRRLDGEMVDVEMTVIERDHAEQKVLQFVASDISERKQAQAELKKVTSQLVQASRQAGMAEVATGVLHNVGNVLNSINVSVTLMTKQLKQSRVAELGKIAAVLDEHDDDLAAFFANDERAASFPQFIGALHERLVDEQDELRAELGALNKSLVHVKNIVSMQQSYARTGGVEEALAIDELLDDVLKLFDRSFDRHEIEVDVVIEGDARQPLILERHRTLLILVNLLSNARHALRDHRDERRRVVLSYVEDGDHFELRVADNGTGIDEEDLTKIFAHGFTTKQDGHGFGLHSSALAAKEMGGSLSVHSDGPGKGATFTVRLPLKRT